MVATPPIVQPNAYWQDVANWLGQQGVSDAQAFQGAIDAQYNTYGGGHVWAPPGLYKTPGLILKGSVLLHGSGRGSGGTILCSGAPGTSQLDPSWDAPIMVVDGKNFQAAHCGLFDLQFAGYMAIGNQQHNLITVTENVPCHMERVRAEGGDAALYNLGNDGRIFNCLFSGKGLASLATSGANWYIMTSFDAPAQGPKYGIYIDQPTPTCQQAGAMENFFHQCDMSGGFSSGYAIAINDVGWHLAYTDITQCVLSSGANIASAKYTQFAGGTRFGGTPWAIAAGQAVSVGDCQSIGQLNLPANVIRGSGNINITGGTPG